MVFLKWKDEDDGIPVFGLPENLFIIHIAGGWPYKNSGFLYKLLQVGSLIIIIKCRDILN